MIASPYPRVPYLVAVGALLAAFAVRAVLRRKEFDRIRTALTLCADLALFAVVFAYAAQTDAGRVFDFEHDL